VQHLEGRFTGVGGLEICWQSWRELIQTRAVVVISHGAGEHGGRYRRLGEHLASLGYPAFAIDHRGHGRSGGPRALVDRLHNAAVDLDQLVDLAREQYPSSPLYLLGHSLGGTIALVYCSRSQAKLDGLILSGPVVVLEPMPSPLLKVVARSLSRLLPGAPAFGVDPVVVSRDPREVQAYRDDPLVHHRKLPMRTVAEIAAAVERFPGELSELRLPMLLVHGSEDRLAPVAGSRLAYERSVSEDKTLKIYDGLFHEVLNELKKDRDRVVDDITAWLQVRTAPESASHSTPTFGTV